MIHVVYNSFDHPADKNFGATPTVTMTGNVLIKHFLGE